jgi:hypothetical protein
MWSANTKLTGCIRNIFSASSALPADRTENPSLQG